jgi:hypothetical protein
VLPQTAFVGDSDDLRDFRVERGGMRDRRAGAAEKLERRRLVRARAKEARLLFRLEPKRTGTAGKKVF